MKLSSVTPNVELSSDDLGGSLFSIGDHSVVFDILRSKMYSNPILAICKEISCNARDAHREVGKFDEPIQIILPSTLDPFFRVKDWGPGISPDRIENIFIKYGSSTKRGDNIQTGAFGMGAKTPFSYSDTFTIETVHQGKKYNYACIIDETKVGKLIKMSAPQITDSPNCTEIIIPVKPKDYYQFQSNVEYATRHWDVKPIIKGDALQYMYHTYAFKGNGWAILEHGDAQSNIKIIIDGIEYPLDFNQVKTFVSSDLIYALASSEIVLFFKTGEVSLSANRETIHLDKETQAKIVSLIDVAFKELKEQIQLKLEAFETLTEACIYWREKLSGKFYNAKFIDPTWNKISLRTGTFVIPKNCTIVAYRNSGYGSRTKIYTDYATNITLDSGTALYFNDLEIDVKPKDVTNAFSNKITRIQVLSCKAADQKDLLETIKILRYENLSSIAKLRKSYKNSGERLLIFKLSDQSYFQQSSCAALEEDKNKIVFCPLIRDSWNGSRSTFIKKKGGQIQLDSFNLAPLISDKKVSFYGIDDGGPLDRFGKICEEYVSFEDYLKNKLDSYKNIDFVKVKYLTINRYRASKYKCDSVILARFEKLISSKDSLFLEYMKTCIENEKLVQDKTQILALYELINEITEDQIKLYQKNNTDPLKLEERLCKKYPLLMHLQYHYDKLYEPIAHYINLVEKESENEDDK